MVIFSVGGYGFQAALEVAGVRFQFAFIFRCGTGCVQHADVPADEFKSIVID